MTSRFTKTVCSKYSSTFRDFVRSQNWLELGFTLGSLLRFVVASDRSPRKGMVFGTRRGRSSLGPRACRRRQSLRERQDDVEREWGIASLSIRWECGSRVGLLQTTVTDVHREGASAWAWGFFGGLRKIMTALSLPDESRRACSIRHDGADRRTLAQERCGKRTCRRHPGTDTRRSRGH